MIKSLVKAREQSTLAHRPAMASGGVLIVAFILMYPRLVPCWASHVFRILNRWPRQTWARVATELKYFHCRPSFVEKSVSHSFKCVSDIKWYWCSDTAARKTRQTHIVAQLITSTSSSSERILGPDQNPRYWGRCECMGMAAPISLAPRDEMRPWLFCHIVAINWSIKRLDY